MSELEKHLTTYETSQRLQKAGADFETLFCWAVDTEKEEAALVPKAVALGQDEKWTIICPAYLSSELAVILGEAGAWTTYQKGKFLYIRFTLRSGALIANDKTNDEAEGRGQLFAGMLEQKMIGPKGTPSRILQ